MSYCIHTEDEAHDHQIAKMKDYVQVPLVFVTKKDTELESVKRLATVEYLEEKAVDLIDSPDTDVQVYDSPLECLDAV